MGVVFKALDAPLNRFVAIKMLLPHLAASGAARKRFAREGQAVAAVVDDHVMAIHCVAEWQGVPYLVMTHSRGISLQKRLSDNGPLEIREINPEIPEWLCAIIGKLMSKQAGERIDSAAKVAEPGETKEIFASFPTFGDGIEEVGLIVSVEPPHEPTEPSNMQNYLVRASGIRRIKNYSACETSVEGKEFFKPDDTPYTVGYFQLQLDGEEMENVTVARISIEPAIESNTESIAVAIEPPVLGDRQVDREASPEFPPVRILVHDEEGKPLENVQVSLLQAASKAGGKIVENSEKSDARGVAVNRNLPFGHYEISVRTTDGWYPHH